MGEFVAECAYPGHPSSVPDFGGAGIAVDSLAVEEAVDSCAVIYIPCMRPDIFFMLAVGVISFVLTGKKYKYIVHFAVSVKVIS